MHKNATKCNETLSKWCKNKHGAPKIFYIYIRDPHYLIFLDSREATSSLFLPKVCAVSYYVSGASCLSPFLSPHGLTGRDTTTWAGRGKVWAIISPPFVSCRKKQNKKLSRRWCSSVIVPPPPRPTTLRPSNHKCTHDEPRAPSNKC
jgi:hypothetical protein